MFQIIKNNHVIGQTQEKPILDIKETLNEDGSYKPGKHKWRPITVEGYLESWEGKKDIFLRLYKDHQLMETWSLLGCRPHKNQIIYDSVYFVSNQ